jgi:hypothetical protein
MLAVTPYPANLIATTAQQIRRSFMKYHGVLCSMAFAFSCAVLHHVQIGEIDNTRPKGRAIDIKVNEVGVDLQEAARLADGMSSRGDNRFQTMLAMFQVGPQTGAPAFNDTYPDVIFGDLAEKCPSGKITGLSSIRESRKYPIISGELVKITGWCVK